MTFGSLNPTSKSKPHTHWENVQSLFSLNNFHKHVKPAEKPRPQHVWNQFRLFIISLKDQEI